MILDYINPFKQYENLNLCLSDLKYFAKYKEIVFDLERSGKLTGMGFSIDKEANMYLGFDLNPELLTYDIENRESAELKYIREKLKIYTDFITREGLLDSIKMDNDRVYTVDYYGYVLRISYDFKNYTKRKLYYAIGYFSFWTIKLLIIMAMFAIPALLVL